MGSGGVGGLRSEELGTGGGVGGDGVGEFGDEGVRVEGVGDGGLDLKGLGTGGWGKGVGSGLRS